MSPFKRKTKKDFSNKVFLDMDSTSAKLRAALEATPFGYKCVYSHHKLSSTLQITNRKNNQPDYQSSLKSTRNSHIILDSAYSKKGLLLSTVEIKCLMQKLPTFSRSGSLKARASSLLSMTDAAATSKGVDPRMEGEAVKITLSFNASLINPNKFIGNTLMLF